MKPSLAKLWAADLRSGKFTQATGTLHKTFGMGTSRDDRAGHCCLGVLSCRVTRLKAVKETGWKYDDASGCWSCDGGAINGKLPTQVREVIGLRIDEQGDLVILNDQKAKTFSQIARYVEKLFVPAK